MDIFGFDGYQDFLKESFPTVGPKRGQRAKLAEALNCQTGFISRVIKGDSHFSVEHGIKVTAFMGMTEEESDFFILLLQKDKAGSEELASYFVRKIDQIKKKRELIKNRVQVSKQLPQEDYVEYYSQWHYAAIHILCTIPSFNTKELVATKLQLPISLVSLVVEFLVKNNLIEERDGRYVSGSCRLHLDKNSKMIAKHHMNWRLESIKALELPITDNLHYSGVIAISKKDASKVRNILLGVISKIEKIIIPSQEEDLFVIGMDFIEK